jgi:hypothetical protein
MSASTRLLRAAQLGDLTTETAAAAIRLNKPTDCLQAVQAAISRARINGADGLAVRLRPWSTPAAAREIAARCRQAA